MAPANSRFLDFARNDKELGSGMTGSGDLDALGSWLDFAGRSARATLDDASYFYYRD
jgi:hypothetical protein